MVGLTDRYHNKRSLHWVGQEGSCAPLLVGLARREVVHPSWSTNGGAGGSDGGCSGGEGKPELLRRLLLRLPSITTDGCQMT